MIKKLLLTILFTLVLSGGASAYVLDKCFFTENDVDESLNVKSFDEQKFLDEKSYTIDLQKGVIIRFTILNDDRLKQLKKENPDENPEKFSNDTYKINFANDRIIKGSILRHSISTIESTREITIDLEQSAVITRTITRNTVTGKEIVLFPSVEQCNKSKSVNSDIASSGSGFFINNKGYFITNNHVVDGCTQSKITFKEESIDAELIATDQNLDLALLRAKVKPKDFLNLSNDPPEKLQKIYVAGYPFGKGLSDDLKFTQGIISAVKGYADNSNQIQIDAAINSGNSGGPIVDEDGNLVAVAVSGLDKSASEGIGFGIKASSVRNFLDVNDVEYSTPGILNFGMNANKLNSLLEKSAVYTFCN